MLRIGDKTEEKSAKKTLTKAREYTHELEKRRNGYFSDHSEIVYEANAHIKAWKTRSPIRNRNTDLLF